MNFPTIQYGRRLVSAGNDDFYDILSKSPDFPEEVETFFRQRFCQSVQWSGTVNGDSTEQQYADCFLFWKLPHKRMIVAKLIDAGSDSRGRPHSMRIEAVLIETDKIEVPAAEIFVRLTHTSDWSSGTLSEIQDESQYKDKIEQYINSTAESLLLAPHSNFFAKGIEMVCSPERTEIRHPEPTINPTSTPPIEQWHPSPMQPRGASLLAKCSVVMLVIGIIILGGVTYNTSKENEELERKLVEKQTEYENNYGEMERKLQEEQDKSRNLTNDLEGEKKRSRELEKQRNAARDNADAELRKRNTELEGQVQKYEESFEAIETIIGELRTENSSE